MRDTQNEPGPMPGKTEFVVLMAALMASNALAIDAMLPALPAIGEALAVDEENRRQRFADRGQSGQHGIDAERVRRHQGGDQQHEFSSARHAAGGVRLHGPAFERTCALPEARGHGKSGLGRAYRPCLTPGKPGDAGGRAPPAEKPLPLAPPML